MHPEIGSSSDGSDFTSGGPAATLTGDGSSTNFTFATNASAFTVTTGDHLALRITSNDGEYGVITGGAWSYISSTDEYSPGVLYYMATSSGNWSETGDTGIWYTNTTGGTDPDAYTTAATEAPTADNSAGIIIHDGFTVTVDSSVEIDQTIVNASASLVIPTGITLTIADGEGTDLTVNGTLTNSGTIDPQAGTTVIFSGAVQTVPGAVTWRNLTVSGTDTKTLEGDTTVEDTLDLDATLAVGSYTLTLNGPADIDGTVTVSTGTIDANGAFDATGGTIDFTDAGNLKLGGATITSLGSLDTSRGTVWYDREGVQTVLTDTYYSLNIYGSDTKSTADSGTIYVSGDLTVSAEEGYDVTFSVSDSSTVKVSHTSTISESLKIAGAGKLESYGDFNASGGTVTFDNNGIIDIKGTVTSFGTLSGIDGTVCFSDSDAGQVIYSDTYNCNLKLTGGAKTLGTNLTVDGDLNINLTGSTTSFDTGAYTVEVSGSTTVTSGKLTVTSGTFSTTGTTDIHGTLQVNTGTYTASGDTTFESGATLRIVSGNYVSEGAFDATIDGTIDFVSEGNLILFGATITSLGNLDTAHGNVWYSREGAQTILADNYHNLIINGSGTKTLAGPAGVDGTLTLTRGLVELGDNDLTLGADASVSGTPSASNMIVTSGSGVLKKVFSGTGSFLFPLGDNSGTAEYSPATLNFTSGNFSSAWAGVKVTNGKQPQNGSTTNYLERYWSVTQSGITGFSCNTSFTYLPEDVNGTEEASVYGAKWNGSAWTALDAVNPADHSFSGTVDGFSDFTGVESFPVTYDANGATSGTAPDDQTKIYGVGMTLQTNTGSLERTGYAFSGWNTAADGSGTHYDAGAACTDNAALTLYAQWTNGSYYMAKSNGNWSDTGVWFTNTTGDTDPSGYTTPATEAPNADNSLGIIVNAIVAVDGTVTIDQATVNADKTLTVNNGVKLTIADGKDTDLTVTGALSNSGTINCASGSTVAYNGGNQDVPAIGYSTLSFAGSASGSTKTFQDGTTTLDAEISLTDAIILTGSSASAVTVQVTTPGQEGTPSRVFTIVPSGRTITVSNMTIKGGDVSAFPGSSGYGGAIFLSSGTLILENVTVSGSNAYNGGGICAGSDCNLILDCCTVSGNTATQNGGGIYNASTITALSNSTISGNTATTGGGGGIFNSGTITALTNSTISVNDATTGGGIVNYSGTIYLANTIVINNTATTSGGDIYNNDGCTLNAYYSWYDDTKTSGTINTKDTAPNETTAYAPGDLGALADNGGPTRTMALSSSAPAYQAGTFMYYNATDGCYIQGNDNNYYKLDGSYTPFTPFDPTADKITTDQRGSTRCDPPNMGAFDPSLAVTTQAVSDVSATQATGNGTVTALGGSNPTAHGVCWNTTGSPTTADSHTDEGAVSQTGAFTSTMTGLDPDTPYYVRAYATNSSGTAYGSQVSFTTRPATDATTGDGNWSSGGIWSDGQAPASDQDVIIANNITVDVEAQVNGLTVNPDCTLTIGGSGFMSANNVFTATDSGVTLKVNGAFNAPGTITFNGAGTLELASTVACNAFGTFDCGTGTVVYSADADQNVDDLTYYNLTLSGSGTKTLCGDATVIKTLTLTEGLVRLGDCDLTLGENATIGGTPSSSNMIVTNGSGVLKKVFSGTGSFTFPVGNVTGTDGEYSRATLDFTSGTFGADAWVGVKVTNEKQPENQSPDDYLKRYWTVDQSGGITGFSCDVTFHYLEKDVSGSESEIYGGQYRNNTWTVLNPVVEDLDRRFQATVQNFSDFTGVQGASPESQAKDIAFNNNVAQTQMTVTWTRGGGDKVLVVAREGSAVNANPQNGNGYTADSAFGGGSEIGAGNYVVYKGTGEEVTVTSLNAKTAYHFRAYEFNDTGLEEIYLTDAATDNPNEATTSDGTGVPADVQDAAPNDGDGNGDGIKDSLQTSVASLPSATPDRSYLTVEVRDGCGALNSVATSTSESVGVEDTGYDYPFELVAFTLPCETGTVRVYYHGAESLDDFEYRKYGPTPDDWNAPLWYGMPDVTFDTKEIGGNTVPYAEFVLTEAQLGDDTSVFPIVDQGGVARANAIPTLSQWEMLLLGLLMAAIATRGIRRRSV